jgi:hypothetical protein
VIDELGRINLDAAQQIVRSPGAGCQRRWTRCRGVCSFSQTITVPHVDLQALLGAEGVGVEQQHVPLLPDGAQIVDGNARRIGNLLQPGPLQSAVRIARAFAVLRRLSACRRRA